MTPRLLWMSCKTRRRILFGMVGGLKNNHDILFKPFKKRQIAVKVHKGAHERVPVITQHLNPDLWEDRIKLCRCVTALISARAEPSPHVRVQGFSGCHKPPQRCEVRLLHSCSARISPCNSSLSSQVRSREPSPAIRAHPRIAGRPLLGRGPYYGSLRTSSEAVFWRHFCLFESLGV